MPKLTAFVARSFDPEDERRIAPIIKFLESFTSAGFIPKSADRAEVESVSKKVRQMIDDSDVFVAIFTRRFAVYDFGTRRWPLLHLILGKVAATKWSAPSWVIQESGYALKANRKMIVFRESGVDLPSLQGDLTYIEFIGNDFAPAFQKASEMINGLLADSSGQVVETIVRVAPPKAENQDQAQTQETPKELDDEKPKSIGYYFVEMSDALKAKEWDHAHQAFEKTLALARDEKEKPSLEMFVTVTYHRFRYCYGQAEGLDCLQLLMRDNPSDPTPLRAIGLCLDHFEEHERAAEYFLRADALKKDPTAVSDLTLATQSLRKAKKYVDARRLLVSYIRNHDASASADPDLRNELYSTLKDAGDAYEALALGELVLEENPGLANFRFSVAYDHSHENFDDLALFHYRIVCDNDTQNATALNNLGVAYRELRLPIHSIDSYKRSFQLGNTLAADNLAQIYIDSGFRSEARNLINEAMKLEDYVPKLPRTLASIGEFFAEETTKENGSLETGEKHRRFLLRFGAAFLEKTLDPAGSWAFPEFEIGLAVAGSKLSGETQITVPVNNPLLGSIYGLSPQPSTEIRKITFSGTIEGMTCKFQIDTEKLEPGTHDTKGMGTWGSTLGKSISTKKGRIAFSPDEKSADVCEIENEKPSGFYVIRKTKAL